MKKWIVILLSLLLPLALPAHEAQSADDGLSFDMDEYLYGHVRDSYEWHITTVKGKPVSIPLPVIVISKAGGGFHCFSSRHLEEGEYKHLAWRPGMLKHPKTHKTAFHDKEISSSISQKC